MIVGAATVMLPRIFVFFMCFVNQFVVSSIVMLGAKPVHPVAKWRRAILDFFMWLNTATIMKVCFFRTELVDKDVDYSYYLGNDYK